MVQLLASIASQVGVDFSQIEIIMVRDGGGNIPGGIKIFPLNIKLFQLHKNVGPGMVRQVGIDKAIGDYIMFCDADDVLHNVGALQALLQVADRDSPDIIRSIWIEEILNRVTGEMAYINHEGENTWMHGKLFKREFLQTCNIRFHPELRVHEDTYFLAVAASCTQSYAQVPVVTYMWRFNPDSITRRNEWEYEHASLPEFFRAAGMAHDAIAKINPGQMEYKTIQLACYAYFILHNPKWNDWQEQLAETELAFADSVRNTWSYFKQAPQERINQIYNEERGKHFSGQIETETLHEWLGRLGL